MHALTILHRCLGPLLTGIHARRLATLLEAVAATVCGPRLTLTTSAGASAGGKPTQPDQALGPAAGQPSPTGQARTIYAALARKLLSGVLEPLIVIDWSDLKADQSLHLLRASLPVGGRSLTLYEEVHPQGKLGNRQVQHASYSAWRSCCRPRPSRSSLPIPASRCRSSASRAAGLALGRSGARARLHQAQALAQLHARVSRRRPPHRPASHGEVGAQQPAARDFVLVRLPRQGRQAKTAAGKRARSKKSQHAARSCPRALLLVASTRLPTGSQAAGAVYRQRCKLSSASAT